MTDPHPNTTADAQEWAKAINAGDTYLPQEWTEAAADLITDLTENWVSIKAMQEWRRKHRGSISDNALKDFADLLPATPTMDEIEWDDAEHHLAEASVAVEKLDGNISDTVIMLGVNRFGNISALDTSTWAAWALSKDTLTPTGRKYRLEPEDDVAYATGGELTTQDVVDECRAVRKERAAAESTTPRPEDVPVGEPWQVEVGGQEAIGYRNGPGTTFPWAFIRGNGPASDYCGDVEVTLIARLVPETTKQGLPLGDALIEHVNRTSVEHHQERMRVNEFDPAYTYRDKDGDKWTHNGNGWVCNDSDQGFDAPPAEYGPYTRIEKDTNG